MANGHHILKRYKSCAKSYTIWFTQFVQMKGDGSKMPIKPYEIGIFD